MSDEPFSHQGSDTRRLDRVETEVDAMRSTVSEMRSDIRSVFSVVNEIKDALKTRDHREAQTQLASKPPIVAIISVLVAIVTSLIVGSWAVSGNISRLDERDIQRDKQMARMELELDRIEKRQWQLATGNTQ